MLDLSKEGENNFHRYGNIYYENKYGWFDEVV